MHDELFDLLRAEHARIMTGFHELAKSGEREQRERLVSRLYLEVGPHLAGEEKSFYPSLNKTEPARESALKAVEEHHVARIMMEELLETPGDDERFKARATVLQELLSSHIEEEEKEVFAMFTKVVNAGEAQGVLDSFQRERDRNRAVLEGTATV